MSLIKSLIAVVFTALKVIQAHAAKTEAKKIEDPNYICIHTNKPEALVFKTTSPQKIWKTSVLKTGEIKKEKASEFKKV